MYSWSSKRKMLGHPTLCKGVIHLMKKELIDIVSKYDDIFQEPDGLPPKREIQHEIHLQQDSPLPNVGMYKDGSCGDDRDQEVGMMIIGSRGHWAQFISLWFSNRDGAKEIWHMVNVCRLLGFK